MNINNFTRNALAIFLGTVTGLFMAADVSAQRTKSRNDRQQTKASEVHSAGPELKGPSVRQDQGAERQKAQAERQQNQQNASRQRDEQYRQSRQQRQIQVQQQNASRQSNEQNRQIQRRQIQNQNNGDEQRRLE